MSKKSKQSKRRPREVKAARQDLQDSQDSIHPEPPVHPVKKVVPLYRQKPPRPRRETRDESREPKSKGRAALPRSQAEQQLGPTTEFRHPHFLGPAHFELREDGSIAPSTRLSPPVGEKVVADRIRGNVPRLVFHDASHRLWLYHGNSLELLDAIAAKYPEGRFDAIFADPPYFLSNGGITCHAGKMVKVDKGDWDVSRGPELNHEFNTEWLRRCQRVLKPNGTIWVTGTHHVIFSIGYALQQLGFKILNDIAWEKPNPPPNLSCRYFTHSTETVLWAAKNEKSKHVFNYSVIRQIAGGKQMKTVWRDVPSVTCQVSGEHDASHITRDTQHMTPDTSDLTHDTSHLTPVWTLAAPSSEEKRFGKHPTQKPVALVERCLLASTNEGDLVLDPFLGNGTTAVASLRLKRGCVGVEADLAYISIAAKRVHREIIEIWLRHFRVRMEISVCGRDGVSPSQIKWGRQHANPPSQIDLAIFSDSINGSRDMADVPEIQTERIFHECKFVFLSCAQVERGAVVHTTVDVSLQEAWAKTPTGKKRETTHVVRCETEIFRVK